ncbi:MAG: DUF4417 domain-containing protein [Fibrobacter sp.]|nr:DUF4417 domain-containing protein [Fibrobacter sp.]
MPKNNKFKATIDDGFQPELVQKARFEGVFEIPVIVKPKRVFIPDGITPFSRRNEAPTDSEAIGFFEMDPMFADVLRNPQAYVEELKNFPAVISPDCSLCRDAPLTVQIANAYKKNAITHYWQSMGVGMTPLVRWGSRDTYTTDVLPEPIAFAGIPHDSIIAISTYGCIKTKDDKYHFEAGLDACLRALTHKALPQILQDGLKPMQRQYVHLSVDVDSATRVGKRRDGNPVILKIDTEAAQKAGIQFFIGNDKVWLCGEMPKDFLSIFTPRTSPCNTAG